MGVIRGVLIVFVCVVLFLVIFFGNVFLTMGMSLTYDNVKAGVEGFFDDMIEQQNLESTLDGQLGIMQTFCLSNPEYVFETSTSNGKSFDFNFILPCEVISQGSQGILSYLKTDFIEKIYYEDYNCEFWDCLEKTKSPFFLISEKAKSYWNSKFYFTLLVSLVLITIIFLLTEKKSNTFIIAGSLLIFAGLPFVKLDWALSFTQNKSVLELLSVFFNKSYVVFLLSLVAGIVLILIGVLFKVFNMGFKISEFFSKISKKCKETNKISKEVNPMKEESKKVKEIKKKSIKKLKKKSK